MQQMEYGNGLK